MLLKRLLSMTCSSLIFSESVLAVGTFTFTKVQMAGYTEANKEIFIQASDLLHKLVNYYTKDYVIGSAVPSINYGTTTTLKSLKEEVHISIDKIFKSIHQLEEDPSGNIKKLESQREAVLRLAELNTMIPKLQVVVTDGFWDPYLKDADEKIEADLFTVLGDLVVFVDSLAKIIKDPVELGRQWLLYPRASPATETYTFSMATITQVREGLGTLRDELGNFHKIYNEDLQTALGSLPESEAVLSLRNNAEKILGYFRAYRDIFLGLEDALQLLPALTSVT